MTNKKSIIIFVTLIIFVFFASLVISKNLENRVTENKKPTSKKNVELDNEFAIKFIKMVDRGRQENYLISPYSVEIALNMLKDGANGESAKQIEKLLNNKVVNILNYKNNVNTANGLFVKDVYKDSISNEYVKKLKNNYSADVLYDSFTTPLKINDWVNEKTKKMIPELIKEIDNNFVLALVNALAIDVEWEEAFECKRTSEEKFYIDDTTINVAMMHKNDSSGKYFETDNAKGIILSYKNTGKNEGLELIAILPNDINTYVESFDKNELDAIDKYKENKDEKIALSIPKFTYDYELKDFKEILIQMGVKDVFDGSKADLSKMFKNNNDFYVSKAIHKTHIELDEKGTKAAAATGFIVSKNAVSEPNKELVFDKPFLYLIRDKKTKEILFFGKLYEPNKWEGSECNEEND